VIGKLVAPKDLESAPVWHFAMISLQGAYPAALQIPWPKDLDPNEDREAAIKWWEAWKETPEGKRYQEEVKQYSQNARQRQRINYGTKVEADGSFTFDDIPAGDYQLSVQLRASPPRGQVAPGVVIATLRHVFTVPEMPVGRSDQPLELGALPLESRGPR